ncbi:DUF6953 family protein [Xylophilus ampelinus]|uniref:DUF6953 family protein n=1 Tax=Xylophilus ampelinus TaxID=54067 RepID=UPI000D7C4499|nr:hypothetical protein [Xylophilus ampelinus]MCS4508874.1 hypothetical protein [Xylophilus ampelinus]
MSPNDIATWMLAMLERDGCIYQDDTVDLLARAGADSLLRENADGNVVLARSVLLAFNTLSGEKVVWVRPDRYWRWRVNEDEPGREASG